MNEEIGYLERENHKLRSKLNMKDDDGVIDLDEENSSEDEIEV